MIQRQGSRQDTSEYYYNINVTAAARAGSNPFRYDIFSHQEVPLGARATRVPVTCNRRRQLVSVG